jgi:hypothetical protein
MVVVFAPPLIPRKGNDGNPILAAADRRATHIQIGSVKYRFFFVFGISVRCTMIFEPLSLAIHLVKNTLAGQFGFASALAEPNPCMFFE